MLLRRMLIMLLLFVLVVGAFGAYKGFSIFQMVQTFKQPKPPISISATYAKSQLWQSQLPAIGSLKALQGVDLSAEVSGTVSKIQFESGQKIERDHPIIELDSAVERASLATAEATLGLAQVEFERARNLIARQAISKSEFDRLSAELQKARANVEQLRATLDKKRVLAPFGGTLGIRQVDLGTYLSAGTTIATLQDLSSLFVDFSLPEQEAPRLSIGQQVLLEVAAYPDEVYEAKIVAINPKVETTTRSLQVRALLENPEGKLLPGMFTNLRVLLPNPQEQVVVPETAVTFTLYGNSVYVVKPDPEQPKTEEGEDNLIVERRFVTTGERNQDQVVLLKGVEPGEQVVTAGQLKLDNGSRVRIEPAAHGKTPSTPPSAATSASE